MLNSEQVPIVCEIYGSVIQKSALVPLYHLANRNLINTWVDGKINTESNIEQILEKTKVYNGRRIQKKSI